MAVQPSLLRLMLFFCSDARIIAIVNMVVIYIEIILAVDVVGKALGYIAVLKKDLCGVQGAINSIRSSIFCKL